eukprot:9451619-Pyramimonas_sp.AAC.1
MFVVAFIYAAAALGHHQPHVPRDRPEVLHSVQAESGLCRLARQRGEMRQQPALLAVLLHHARLQATARVRGAAQHHFRAHRQGNTVYRLIVVDMRPSVQLHKRGYMRVHVGGRQQCGFPASESRRRVPRKRSASVLWPPLGSSADV